MKKSGSSGFTLVELMITVVILGILVGIAYPGYQKYTIQTRRTDAQIALTQAANLQERFFTECNWYAANLTGARSCDSNTTGVLNSPSVSPGNHYAIALNAGTIVAATCTAYSCGYTLTADPSGAGVTGLQAGDGKFRIDSTGLKQWDRNNDNDYADAGENNWNK